MNFVGVLYILRKLSLGWEGTITSRSIETTLALGFKIVVRVIVVLASRGRIEYCAFIRKAD